jgi:hypothetical protein
MRPTLDTHLSSIDLVLCSKKRWLACSNSDLVLAASRACCLLVRPLKSQHQHDCSQQHLVHSEPTQMVCMPCHATRSGRAKHPPPPSPYPSHNTPYTPNHHQVIGAFDAVGSASPQPSYPEAACCCLKLMGHLPSCSAAAATWFLSIKVIRPCSSPAPPPTIHQPPAAPPPPLTSPRSHVHQALMTVNAQPTAQSWHKPNPGLHHQAIGAFDAVGSASPQPSYPQAACCSSRCL